MIRSRAGAALLAGGFLSICVSFQSSAWRESAPVRVLRVGAVWEPHEFAFASGETGPGGSALDEAGVEPFNPWLNWRLAARFRSPSGETFDVPGFYAGDDDGSGSGDVWKVRFAPDRPGVWRVRARLEYARTPINVEPLAVAGERLVPFAPRAFHVRAPDPAAPGFLARGPLTHVGESYLSCADGSFWIKGGTNSPENFFAYAGFDGASDTGGLPQGQNFLHEYAPHVSDWTPGDPDWAAGGDPHAGRGIIGALNYLAAEGVNSIYFLPNNLGGDGRDTFPFVHPFGSSFFNTHWDASRMEQWNTVMEHATRKGILLHMVLAEQELENVTWLGSGLSTERKLFFKNLVAMFGHNLGIKFDFCEENAAEPGDEFSVAELQAFADYVALWDVYDHPLSVHTQADDLELYAQILSAPTGTPWLTSTALQLHDDYGAQVESARALAALNGGLPLVVDQDEQGPVFEGLSATNADVRRREVLYDVYFSGGNIEWYFGLASLPVGGDLDVENFRTREPMWRYMRHARTLLESFPFWRMQPDDDLLQGEAISTLYGGAEVFAERGRCYLIYYPRVVDTGNLDLTHLPPGSDLTGTWFNPRTGRTQGAPHAVPSGTLYDVPVPPADLALDWVFVVR